MKKKFLLLLSSSSTSSSSYCYYSYSNLGKLYCNSTQEIEHILCNCTAGEWILDLLQTLMVDHLEVTPTEQLLCYPLSSPVWSILIHHPRKHETISGVWLDEGGRVNPIIAENLFSTPKIAARGSNRWVATSSPDQDDNSCVSILQCVWHLMFILLVQLCACVACALLCCLLYEKCERI